MKKTWRFFLAFFHHLRDGFRKVDGRRYRQRLEICNGCQLPDGPTLKNSRCRVCACIVSIKASWRSEDCPLGQWPPVR